MHFHTCTVSQIQDGLIHNEHSIYPEHLSQLARYKQCVLSWGYTQYENNMIICTDHGRHIVVAGVDT